MVRRKRTEEDYDFRKEEGLLSTPGRTVVCLCEWDEEQDVPIGTKGCPIHDPLYHDRKSECQRNRRK